MATACRLRIFKTPLRLLLSRTFCAHESSKNQPSILPFDNKEVKSILKKITGRNLDKIYAARKQDLAVPSYKLMTDSEFLKVRGALRFIRMHSDNGELCLTRTSSGAA